MGNYVHKKCKIHQLQATRALLAEKEHLQELFTNIEENHSQCVESLQVSSTYIKQLQHSNTKLTQSNDRLKLTLGNAERSLHTSQHTATTLQASNQRFKQEHSILIDTLHVQEKQTKNLMKQLEDAKNKLSVPSENNSLGSVVMIESPYSGQIDRHVRYTALCCIDAAIVHDELGYASHGVMTQHPRCKEIFVSDFQEKWDTLTRDEAIAMSHRMRRRCDKTVFYTDLGWSSGMTQALDYCKSHRIPFELRKVNTKALAQRVPYLTSRFIERLTDREAAYTECLA